MSENKINNLAVRGFDVVSYFSNEAKLGDPAISKEHEGATYYFSSDENKEKFEINPGKYIPAYEGLCAFAMSEGKSFDIDPRSFKIIDGKLHLFYNGVGGDTKSMWEQNETERINKARQNWANSA